MWLSKKMTEATQEETPSASLGEITISGDSSGVLLDSEQRGVSLISPGGFRWRPKTGQTVLVLKTGEGESVVAGAVQQDAGVLQGGEMMLCSDRASIMLKNDGSISVQGNLSVSGDLGISGGLSVGGSAEIAGGLSVGGNAEIVGGLTVAGTPYSPCVCSLLI